MPGTSPPPDLPNDLPPDLPNDPGPDDRRVGRTGVLVAVVAGCVGAALVGSATLPGWADKLPPSAATTALGDAARGWQAMLSTVGLTRPYAAIRAGVRAMEARKFPAPDAGDDD